MHKAILLLKKVLGLRMLFIHVIIFIYFFYWKSCWLCPSYRSIFVGFVCLFVFCTTVKVQLFVYSLPTLTHKTNKQKLSVFFLTKKSKQNRAWHLLRSLPHPCTCYLWSHLAAHCNQGRNSIVRISNFHYEHFLLLTCAGVFSHAISWWGI